MAGKGKWKTHKRHTAISAPANLRLVYVDKYPWMAERSSATVARDNPAFLPTNWLFVYKLYRGVRSRLVH